MGRTLSYGMAINEARIKLIEPRTGFILEGEDASKDGRRFRNHKGNLGEWLNRIKGYGIIAGRNSRFILRGQLCVGPSQYRKSCLQTLGVCFGQLTNNAAKPKLHVSGKGTLAV